MSEVPAPEAAPPRSRRIDGLDVARAVAILGMVGSHVGDEGTRGSDLDGWAWLAISHGLPSSLFAVLAGVSMTLMLTRRGTVAVADVTDTDANHTRWRIAVRGVILIIAGWALALLGTPVDIILTNLGLMFLLALPALRWSTRALVIASSVFVVVGGWVANELFWWTAESGFHDVFALGKLWSFHYPALAWMGYILAGLVIGRIEFQSDRRMLRLAVLGLVGALAARGAGWLLLKASPGGEDWFDSGPHTYTPIEMAQNIGIACTVIGLAVWTARRLPRLLWPLMAAGSMALTLYVAHLFVIYLVGPEMVYEPTNAGYVALCAGLVGFACVWRATVGQGPLEAILTTTSTWVADRRSPRIGATP